MDIIEKLQQYTLDQGILRTLPNYESLQSVKKINTPVHKKRTGLFIPRSNDTLFWCFYIITEGKDAYYMTGNHKFQIEKNKKISFIEKIRENKDLIKANKLKINELENDLLNNRCINYKTFIALCLLYNINVIIIFDNYYYEYTPVPATETNIIRIENKKFGIEFETSNVAKELTSYWKMDNIIKPLKGISTYKITELRKIYKYLYPVESETKIKLTKQKIYNLIRLKIE